MTDDGGANSVTPRGFTGHALLDDLGLVHMNGRIYDPLLGRFLSADLLVENPGNLQCFNRYSYVRNNPLSLTDPSGFASDSGGDEETGSMFSWFAGLFVSDNSSNPVTAHNPDAASARANDEPAVRDAGRFVTNETIKTIEAQNAQVQIAIDVVPGLRPAIDSNQAITGKDMIGRPASREEGLQNLGQNAALGMAAGKVGTIAKDVVGKLGSVLSKEGGAVARLETTAVKDGLKSEVQAATDAGRTGKQARLNEIGSDPNTSSADRGWIKQEKNSIERGQRDTIRNPPGKDLAHERGREAAKGFSYKFSNLVDRVLHKIQHKFDDFGRKNKPRPAGPKKKPNED